MPYEPGKYEVIRPVNIRRDPKVSVWTEGWGKKKVTKSNYEGMYNSGKQIDVFEIHVAPNTDVWGRVTEYNSTGHANWICVRNANGEFAREADPESESNANEELWRLFKLLEGRITALEIKLEGK